MYNKNMIIVVDANIFIHILLNGAEKGILIHQTWKHTITAPDVLPFEIGNALINLHRKQKLNTQQLIAAFRQFKNIPVRLQSINIEKSLEIAMLHNIYAYDAYYLETALRHRLPLLTHDKKMKNIANTMNIRLLEDLL